MKTKLSRRQFLRASVVAAAAAAAPVYRAYAQAGKKTLVYAKNEDIGQLNPYFANHAVFETLANHILEPLVRFDYERRLFEPVLAESWAVEDKGRTWVFRLRDGVRFHNGAPLTAEDVKYSFESILTQKSASSHRVNVFMIDAVRVRDRRTVALHCKQAIAGLLSYIQSRPPIMSRVLGDNLGFDEAHKKMVGTGPFRFVEYVRDERLVMERNADYWGPAARIDRVVYRPIPDSTTRVTALRAGQVDAIAQVPTFELARLEGSPEVRLDSVRAARIQMLFMNPIIPALQSRLVRQAIHHAIDIDTIIKTILDGRASRLTQLVGPTQAMSYDPELRPFAYDPERSKRLLADAGYAGGLDVDFYDYPSYSEYRPMALAVAEQLRKVGVRLSVKSVETGVFRRMWFASEMPMFFVSYGNAAEDASAFFKIYFRSADRRSRYRNPEVDALFDQQEEELDPKRRQALNRQLVRVLQEDSPGIPLYNPLHTVGLRRHVALPPGAHTAGEFVWFWKMDVA